MGKFWKQNKLLLALTLVLGALALFGFTQEETELTFSVETEGGVLQTGLYGPVEDCYYVFLPSFAQMEQVTVTLPRMTEVWLGDTRLETGMACGDFALDTPYRLELGGEAAELRFLRSANVAAVSITTASGSLDRIHADKTYEEAASVTVVTAAGQLSGQDTGARLQGRGNATWKYEKKPYSLTLSGARDLLGMGAATEWVLLANATDQSNLHNYLALTLARNSGLEWTPECRFADVYINGEYQGLYLLTERVEIGPERLDIDAAAGDFLGKIDFASRWDTLRSPFRTESGRTVEITGPKDLDQAQTEAIQTLVNGAEAGILSGTLGGIDLDSWVRRYLVDEITGNIDADMASSYIYGKDGLLYAGPVWDYDRAFGNTPRNDNPASFIAKNLRKSESSLSPYYGALYEDEAFRTRISELYQTEFLPQLEAWTAGGIAEAARQIEAASRMNDIRWAAMFAHLQEVDPSPEALTEYVRRRTDFLSSAWLEGKDYCTVQLELTAGGFYRNFAVERGESLDPETVWEFLTETSAFPVEADPASAVWTDRTTGEETALDAAVTEDRILRLSAGSGEAAAQEAAAQESGETAFPWTAAASAGLLLLLLSLLVLADRGRRR